MNIIVIIFRTLYLIVYIIVISRLNKMLLTHNYYFISTLLVLVLNLTGVLLFVGSFNCNDRILLLNINILCLERHKTSISIFQFPNFLFFIIFVLYSKISLFSHNFIRNYTIWYTIFDVTCIAALYWHLKNINYIIHNNVN